ncbi:hypothetical protein [Paenibacillus peoriae]|uniref:hypothetical protein n=2 Tax=Paenibacillus TaxID=44249 RepID=UPI00215AEA8F|nr:hypothetical protein [Paenibacillus peoriae]QYK67428.1 hypothetical protein KAI36_02578 [Paenibacillus sp. S02]
MVAQVISSGQELASLKQKKPRFQRLICIEILIKIIFVNPESEYRELCMNLNGDWINAGGDFNGRMNPIEIRPTVRDEDGEEHPLYKDEGHGMSDMALHLKNFEIFFNLYLPALNMIQKAVLKKCLPFLFQLTQADITNIAITEDIDPLREEIRG